MIEEALQLAWPHVVMLASAFVAASLLPVSSEVVLAAQIKAAVASPLALVATATVGNVAGSAFNWWLGHHARRLEGRRWFPFTPEAIAAASTRFRRYGLWSLLLSWLPIVGDPLTFVAGVLRVPILLFLPLVTIGKGARYLALMAAIGS